MSFIHQRKQLFKDGSIQFRGPMVRAILEGRKRTVRIPFSWTTRKPFFPGDVLWVGEHYLRADRTNKKSDKVRYEADYIGENHRERYVPGQHMKKSMSRIDLRVNDVVAERLHDITTEGLKAEGFDKLEDFIRHWNRKARYDDQIKWRENPIVWVVYFTRIRPISDVLCAPASNCY